MRAFLVLRNMIAWIVQECGWEIVVILNVLKTTAPFGREIWRFRFTTVFYIGRGVLIGHCVQHLNHVIDISFIYR